MKSNTALSRPRLQVQIHEPLSGFIPRVSVQSLPTGANDSKEDIKSDLESFVGSALASFLFSFTRLLNFKRHSRFACNHHSAASSPLTSLQRHRLKPTLPPTKATIASARPSPSKR
jgi:hypothetical protein